MAHLLRFPTAGAPTATCTLDPSLVRVQEYEDLRPAQRSLKTPNGTRWALQLSGNRLQAFRASFQFLHEADRGANSGLTSLLTFIDSVLNYGMNPCDFTHQDGTTTKIWVLPDSVRFTEVQYLFWSGEFLMDKYLV